MNDLLNHLTLNTGHLRASPRSEVHGDVRRALRPIAETSGGPIPGLTGWYLHLIHSVESGLDGSVYFQIARERGRSQRPVVQCMLCWQASEHEAAWNVAREGYTAHEPELRTMRLWRAPPPKPPTVPWLAVWLTPFVVRVDPLTLCAFGDLERCVAWTLLDHAR